MRLQLSLNISDNEIIKVCKALKETKELNSVVVRLLHAYVYDEKDLSGVYTDIPAPFVQQEEKDYSAEYDNIRSSLEMMGILLDDSKNLFADSAETFSDYMEHAMSSGACKAEETDTGGIKIIPRLLTDNSAVPAKKLDRHGEPVSEYAELRMMTEGTAREVSALRSDVTSLKKFLKIEGDDGTIKQDIQEIKEVIAEREKSVAVPTAEESVTVETVEETVEPKVELDDGVTFEAEPEDDGIELAKDDTPVAGEAASDINDLLSSLF